MDVIGCFDIFTRAAPKWLVTLIVLTLFTLLAAGFEPAIDLRDWAVRETAAYWTELIIQPPQIVE